MPARAHLVTVLVANGPELSELLARARGFGSGHGGQPGAPAGSDRAAHAPVDSHGIGGRQARRVDGRGAGAGARASRPRSRRAPRRAATPSSTRRARSSSSPAAAGQPVHDARRLLRRAQPRHRRDQRPREPASPARCRRCSRRAWTACGRRCARRWRGRWSACWWCRSFGVYVMRDVTVTLREVVTVANHIAAGDLSVRVQARSRRDELGVLGRAFEQMVASFKDMVVGRRAHRRRRSGRHGHAALRPRRARPRAANMAGRLSGLLSDVHRSGIQVNTSVNEIAASAREQEATATEVAAATTEIAATSREIAATSQELVRTMSEVFTAAEESAALAGQGQAGLTRMEATMRQVMDASSSINTQARRAQREGRQHQPRRHHHHQGGRPDQPAVAQRGHRSREGRRVRPRLRGGGHRDPPPRRPDGGGDLRHRPDGEGDPVGGRRPA